MSGPAVYHPVLDRVTVSVLRVGPRTLTVTDVEPSVGGSPVSVAVSGSLVYVLNAATDSIAGFRLSPHGDLTPIFDSVRPLSGSGTAPAQIAFSPDGDVLLVTEKATNRIVTFHVQADGRPGLALMQASVGQTPFGFAFGKCGQVFVSEAFGGAPNASATSSYEVDPA